MTLSALRDYAQSVRAKREYVAPRNPMEQGLADIFAAVLRVERVGVNDDFFARGGNSLAAVRVLGRIEAAYNVEVPIEDFFTSPTIAALAGQMRAGSGPTAAALELVKRADRTRPIPASFAQSRMWFLDQLEGRSATYNVPLALRMEGALDSAALGRAIQELVNRHEALRTTFIAIDGEPHQVIHPSLEMQLILITASSEDEARVAVSRAVHATFDLGTGPMMHATLVKVRNDAHVLVLCIHHIATDGWSMQVLTRELSMLYGAFVEGKAASPLPTPTLDYADFGVWQRSWLDGEVLERQLSFWRELLAGAPAALELPTDRPRPAIKQHRGAVVDVVLPAVVADGIHALCRREGVTPFMVLLTAYQSVLSRWSGQNDVVVGTAIANRTRHELDHVVGFFVNTLAMRTSFEREASFVDVLRRVKHTAVSAYAQQDVPFERLVDALNVPRDMSRTPIFQAMFVLQSTDSETLAVKDLAFSPERAPLDVAKFDLLLEVLEDRGGFRGTLEYDVALFDQSTIERFVEHLVMFLADALARPELPMHALELMTAAERHRVVVEWNATNVALPHTRPIHHVFEAQAELTPDAIAIESGEAHLTYRELDERANDLAHQLIARGAGRDRIVALVMDRSLEMLIALYAVLKAGAAYAPLDPHLPPARLAFMVRDLQASIVLVQREHRLSFEIVDDVSLVEVDARALVRRPQSASVPIDDAQLAYVIYTSGSTGNPKAAMNTHAGLRNRILWMQSAYGLAADDCVVQKTPYMFDVSVWEFFWPLAVGARLVMARPDGHKDSKYLAELIERSGVTTAHFVPSMLQVFVEEAAATRCKTLRRVLASGEALPRALVDRFHERFTCALHNLYGPTEASIDVTFWECRRGATGEIPIGRPIWNTQIHVVDDRGGPCPIGVSGEVWIGGIGVGRGYWNRPDLTAERFVPDPFATRPGARAYRTGDLGRTRQDGVIDYLGRIDHQVKIRGFRIELGEIESALRSVSTVAEAVVVAREDGGSDKRLIAYVVPVTGAEVNTSALRSTLGKTLPDYMVPSAFVALDALPLTPNGKIDRKALPAPDFSAVVEEYVAPRDATEETLAGIFREVLGLARVGIHDDFFAVGGHSLLATRVVSRIRRLLGIELPVRAVFEAPTVGRLAERARVTAGGPTTAPPLTRVDRAKPLPASFAQTRLWLLDQLEGGGSSTYNVPDLVRVVGALEEAALERALGELVKRHETLRTTFAAIDGEPHQVIHSSGETPLLRVEAISEEDAHAVVAREAHTPFDLATGPLFRATLIRVRHNIHLLLICTHHIATDGWSSGVLARELWTIYEAFAAGQPSPLAPIALDYADFAAWQRGWLTGDVLERQVAFWKELLIGAPAALELPTDRPRPAVKQYRGGAVDVVVPAPIAAALRVTCRREGVTPFMIFLTAYQCVLSRWSGQSDVVVGTAIANRTRQELEGMVGFFVNTLAMRATFAPNVSFANALRRTKQTALAAYAHQDVPFERLVDALKIPRDMSRTPIFQTMFVLQSTDPEARALEHLTVSSEPAPLDVAKFDLSLEIIEDGGSFRGSLQYDRALFDRSTIERFAEHVVTLLGAALDRPEERIARLPLMGEAEKHLILTEWNATARPFERRLVQESIAHNVREQPARAAVVTAQATTTYAQLERRARALCTELMRRGVGRGSIVAVCAPRGIELVVGALAAWKAGAAYLPIDPAYPSERISYVIEDSKARVLVTTRSSNPQLFFSDVVFTEDIGEQAPSGEGEAVLPQATDAAYVIYTSGTTGKPKGSVIEHAHLSHLVDWYTKTFELAPGDRTSMVVSPGFDAAMFEIWTTLAAGATLYVPEDDVRSMAELLRDWLGKNSITVAFAPTPLAEQLLDLDWPVGTALRHLLTGGDRLTKRPRAGVPFVLTNMYGPTECTVVSTAGRVAAAVTGQPSIGGPLDRVTAYVLDADLQPVPIGVAGELLVGGAGVGRGYLDRAALTAEKFIPDPFSSERGARLYRTGDLVRWLTSGEIEFLGRIDQQVKIRGFRIELGEIEAALIQAPQVREAVVIAREDVPGDKRLAAYVVGDGVATIHTDALKKYLRKTLPDFMVPSAFVVLDALPLTPNGKVDRTALPAPEAASVSEFLAPRDETEETLARIWRELLHLDRVGVHDNFFELGGHSLLATQVISRIRKELGVEVGLKLLFEAPTVEGLAQRLPASARAAGPRLVPRSVDAATELSFAQHRLWFLDQLTPGSATYNIPTAHRFEGRFDVDAMARSLHEVVRRHEALRTTFEEDGQGRARQVIHAEPRVALERVNLRHLAAAEREEQVANAISGEAQKPFDLGKGPLLRARLLELGDEEHVMLLTMHHIVSDGWSLGVLMREVTTLYTAFASGKPSPLAELEIQYADYAAWQREWLSGEELDRQVAHWKNELDGAPAALELPTDRGRPPVQTHTGKSLKRALPRPLMDRVDSLSRKLGATPFMILLAAYDVLLSRYSGQTDVVVGTPIANRTRVETEGLIGFFVNTLALRADLSGEPTGTELVLQVKERILAAQAHQDLPLEKLVESLKVVRDMSRSPLFQVMFVLQNTPVQSLKLAGLTVSPVDAELGAAKFDLTLTVIPGSAGSEAHWEYNTDLFDRETVARMATHFELLLEGLVLHPEMRIGELAILTEAERQEILVEWNDTATSEPRNALAHELFEAQAERTPDAVAVFFEKQHVTYRELNARANRLARRLRTLGVGPDQLVALCTERSLEMVIGLLATLKAGGAYVPVDLSNPQPRVDALLNDSGARVVLTRSPLRHRFANNRFSVISVDSVEGEAEVDALSSENLRIDIPTESLAYIIYTSGSTGAPKGVMVTHRGLVTYLRWSRKTYGDGDSIVHTPLSFDLTVTSLFTPLLGGSRAILVPEGADGRTVVELVEADRAISLLKLTPAHMQLFQDDLTRDATTTRTLVVGGEALAWETVLAWRSRAPLARVVNEYGPTEAVVGCCIYDAVAGRERPGTLPIGRPTANTKLYVLDPSLRPVPKGVDGELFIGGNQLARGYRNRPALTAEKFLPDPFDAAGGRMYRTGDLVRHGAGGELEYIGRTDHQVKLRGYRIELGEIEARLLDHPKVRDAVVLGREDTPGDKRLVAYVVASGEEAPGVEALRQHVKDKLPQYMVPSAFVVLETLPLTPNGKVDRKALPIPEAGSLSEFLAPRDETEEAIARIWKALLRVERVGVHDDFFELGGHSLLAMRIIAQIRSTLGHDVPVRALMAMPTVAGLASYIASDREIAPVISRRLVEAPPMTSFVQELLVAWEQRRAPSGTWTAADRRDLRGRFDPGILREAIARIYRKQEVLRWSYDHRSGLRVLDPSKVPFEIVDMTGASAADIDAVCSQDTTPFTFDGSPLVRFLLLRRSADEHTLFSKWHPFVHDPTQGQMISGQIIDHFRSISEGSPSPHEPEIGYADFTAWERTWFEEHGRDEVLAVRKRLDGAKPIEIADRSRTGPVSPEAIDDWFTLDAQTSARLDAYSQSMKVSPFTIFVALAASLLSRWSGSDDVTFVTSINLRNVRADFERLVGRFGNWIPIRVSTAGDPSFSELVARAREAVIDAHSQEAAPAVRVFDTAHVFDHPLCRVVLNVPVIGGSSERASTSVGDVTITSGPIRGRSGARNDLAIAMGTVDGRMFVGLRGAKELFHDDTIARRRLELCALIESSLPRK